MFTSLACYIIMDFKKNINNPEGNFINSITGLVPMVMGTSSTTNCSEAL